MSALDQLISCQDALIAALDARDPGQIEMATADLASAVQMVKAQDVWRSGDTENDQIGHALRQSDAARMRVNYMADWTRQRIDQLDKLRRGDAVTIYTMPCK
jgi:uncharacterized protein YecT (DUF1311 family)